MALVGTSARPLPARAKPKNKVLRCLPTDDFETLSSHLKTIPATARQVFQRRGAPLREILFPNGGGGSITAAMKDGAVGEVAPLGGGGILGVGGFFGAGAGTEGNMVEVARTHR